MSHISIIIAVFQSKNLRDHEEYCRELCNSTNAIQEGGDIWKGTRYDKPKGHYFQNERERTCSEKNGTLLLTEGKYYTNSCIN